MYKSMAQARYMHAAATRGEIPKKVVSEFDEASRGKMKKLPEHVKKSDGGLMRSQALDKWSKRMSRGGYVTEAGEGEMERLSPVDDFDDDEECEYDGYAHGGACYSDGGMCYAHGGMLEPDFRIAIMQDPENERTSEDGEHEEKDLEEEEDLGGEPLKRTPRADFGKGGFVLALRRSRG